MSLETWKKEFYPKPAKDTSRKEALEHSIKKWEGALYKNRRRHQLTFSVSLCAPCLWDDGGFYFDSDSCALCMHYYREEGAVTSGKTACDQCPLFRVTGCQCGLSDDDRDPYSRVCEGASPTVMINALKKARRFN